MLAGGTIMTIHPIWERPGPTAGAAAFSPVRMLLTGFALLLAAFAYSPRAAADSGPSLSGLTADTPDALDAEPFEFEVLKSPDDVTPLFGRRITVCAGQSLPGWAIYNVTTDFTACGGGWDSRWHLIELNGAAPGQTTVICTRSGTPPGWVTIGYHTDFTRCGRNPGRNNLKSIRFP